MQIKRTVKVVLYTKTTTENMYISLRKIGAPFWFPLFLAYCRRLLNRHWHVSQLRNIHTFVWVNWSKPTRKPLKSENCVYLCLTFALCYCVQGTGQHQLGQEVLFSQLHEQTWLPTTHHWLSNFELAGRLLMLNWETKKRHLRTILGPFAIDLSENRTSDSPLQK